jgi:alpha-ketoglutarate-dependent taurine dioxygenase
MSITQENIGSRKLPAFKRKPISVSAEALTRDRYLRSGMTLPLVIEPTIENINLIAWAAENRELIEQKLLEHGGILFRGFPVASAETFQEFCRTLSGELLEYRERSSPRSRVHGHVYSSTDYPADQSIFLHNEHSYSLTFPLRISFFCETPAAQGGETPIAGTRQVVRRIDPHVVQRFVEKKWMYVRNFGDGFGLAWQTVFQTEDKSAVERYCEDSGIEVEWKPGNRLRTRQVRDAITIHPRTGEPIWFNHATFFNVSTLEPRMRETLLAEFGEEGLPNNSYYGDGSPIEPEVLEQLRSAYENELVAFPWHKGDILLLDNMLTAHGRAPYAGERKILVAMAQPITRR